MSEQESSGKPFVIDKQEVWQAYRQVKANKGAPGVDGVDLVAFEADLKNNLYKIWNRMSSGSYFPPPVAAVEIAKSGGGTRRLGVPTIGDRVAQTVAARRLEDRVEPIFHPDSYGYRPGRSALDAVAVCRRRCWKRDWVIDLDVQSFFDSVRWDLLIKAVQAHTDDSWVVLYVRRWLAAPIRLPDGTLEQRERGTPQGSAISPVLANLFLHYAFDAWLVREFPTVTFERYADDAVIHCVTQRQARQVLAAVQERMSQVGLRLHPAKTKIVYCQDQHRRGDYEHTLFTFLGYTFRARAAQTRTGQRRSIFLPAVSTEALKRMGRVVRRWRLHRRTGHSWAGLARWINPIIRGWMHYYGAFYPSALSVLLSRINTYLMRWLRNKYKRLRGWRAARAEWDRVTTRYPRAMVHWPQVKHPLARRAARAV